MLLCVSCFLFPCLSVIEIPSRKDRVAQPYSSRQEDPSEERERGERSSTYNGPFWDLGYAFCRFPDCIVHFADCAGTSNAHNVIVCIPPLLTVRDLQPAGYR